MRQTITRTILVGSLLLLAACSLPRGAAVQSEILRETRAETPSFQVVEVTRASLAALQAWPEPDTSARWPQTGAGPDNSIIRGGDLLDITIWDSQDNSLLTNPNQRFTRIEEVEVDGSGRIFLPYVDQIQVGGLTPAEARQRVQSRLEVIAPSAQVQLSLLQGRDYAIDVVGGVAKPGAYPMPSRNYKILNVLADAGGISSNLRNPQVKLLRGSRTFTISADRLYEGAHYNALLSPRDTVIVEADDRSFVALGASGTEDLIYFPKDHLSALEALSLMGGLVESRADPEGVLVLREYPATMLGGAGPRLPQVVFAFDLTSADGLFAARKFQIQPGDTVLATESPVNNTRMVLGLVGTTFGLTRQATILTN
ncbi:polysaccharide biosynthesis/export family protein [Citreimonas salinaria]|uniref:Polysaccharide export outer membrane protein n=1 Tax=Citreimonas salinaria TaxID=321339 RepID=A0A1H3FFY3_9RHOB|nr:polysaccharide biosynthesis/export family protein [Citreimonas salinaria]SDX89054.1 polysaccharide export outer membrane protein [Citreimonas salinaria]